MQREGLVVEPARGRRIRREPHLAPAVELKTVYVVGAHTSAHGVGRTTAKSWDDARVPIDLTRPRPGMRRQILTDVHLWVPVAVLALGVALLWMLP